MFIGRPKPQPIIGPGRAGPVVKSVNSPKDGKKCKHLIDMAP